MLIDIEWLEFDYKVADSLLGDLGRGVIQGVGLAYRDISLDGLGLTQSGYLSLLPPDLCHSMSRFQVLASHLPQQLPKRKAHAFLV
jgi:hypothetical protein